MMHEVAGFQILSELHRGLRSHIFRGMDTESHATAVLKIGEENVFGKDVLEWEFELLQYLDSPYVVKPKGLLFDEGVSVLVEEDDGMASLDTVIPPNGFGLAQFFPLAKMMVQGLSDIHAANVFHKDIKPANVLVNRDLTEIKYIDFSISSRFREDTTEFSPLEHLQGTLAYMSPEQTGRMNRPVDYRTDFYSLGITFYQMLAGALPVADANPMDLIHFHIAQSVTFPARLKQKAGEFLLAVLRHMLAKDSASRYQTCQGLLYDLEQAQKLANHAISKPPPQCGMKDKISSLSLPNVVLGREPELAILKNLTSFQNRTHCGIAFVAGAPGIGKSVLIQELYQPVTLRQGMFIQGKYDKYQVRTPYSAIISAVDTYIEHLLCQSSQFVEEWREQCKSTLGSSISMLCNLVGSLQTVMGVQDKSWAVGGMETQHRLVAAFSAFFDFIATDEHPLVLFLDDTQWADVSSLKLIEEIARMPGCVHLTVVCAYRDTEVDSLNPTMQLKASLDQVNVPYVELPLGPLTRLHLDTYVNLTLAEPNDELNEFLWQKSNGNPFYIKQLLSACFKQGLLNFDSTASRWRFDGSASLRHDGMNDVVSLLSNAIHTLPKGQKELLTSAACVGNEFESSILSEVTGVSAKMLRQNLLELVNQDYLCVVDGDFRRIGRGNNQTSVRMAFTHDRFLQAAYEEIPEERRMENRLAVGRMLHKQLGNSRISPFDVAGHLNAGVHGMTDVAEIAELVDINIECGKQANLAAAWHDACQYFAMADRLVHEHAIELPLHTLFFLKKEYSRSLYLTGMYDEADRIYREMEQMPLAQKQSATVLLNQMEQCIISGEFDKGIDVCRRGLALYGEEMPPTDTLMAKALGAEFAAIDGNFGNRSFDDIFQSAPMVDVNAMGKMRFLDGLSALGYLSSQANINGWAVMRMTNLSLQYGHIALSSFAYAFSALIYSLAGDYAKSKAFGDLGIGLANRDMDLSVIGRSYASYFALAAHHTTPYATLVERLAYVLPLCMRGGDLLYASFAQLFMSLDKLLMGVPLEELAQLIDDEQIQFFFLYAPSTLDLYFQPSVVEAVRILTERPPHAFGLTFDEEEFQRTFKDTPIALGWHAFCELMVSWLLYEDFPFEKITQRIEYLNTGPRGQAQVMEGYFYGALSVCRSLREKTDDNREARLAFVDDAISKMEIWQTFCPQNFGAKYHVMMAERLRTLNGPMEEAVSHYKQAISMATHEKMINIKAVALLCYGEYWWAIDGLVAKSLVRQAEEAFARWQAHAVITRLRRRFPAAFEFTGSIAFHGETPTSESVPSFENSRFDLNTILQVSSVLSVERDFVRLLQQTVHTLMGNAGATRCVLMLPGTENLELLVDSDDHDSVEHDSTVFPDNCTRLPCTLINKARNGGVAVVENDVQLVSGWQQDTYLAQSKVRSLICLPVYLKGELALIVYMENNLVADAFPETGMDVLMALGTLAAISIANAKYLERREKAEKELQAARDYIDSIIDAMPSSLVGVNSDGRITHWNAQAARETSITAAMAAGKPLTEVMPYYRSEVQHIYNVMNGTGEYRKRHHRYRTSGGECIEDITIFPVDAGGVHSAVIRIDDVTSQVQMSETLIQSEKMLSMGGLAAGMAHEINNPLSGIMQSASVLSMRLLDENLPGNRKAAEQVGTRMSDVVKYVQMRSIDKTLELISDSSAQAAQIVRNMLNFARKSTSDFTSVKITDLMEKCIEVASADFDLNRNFDFRKIKIERNYGSDLPSVYCDAGKIQQVFFNILKNGAEAMAEKQTALGLSYHPAFHLRISSDAAAHMIQVEIGDNGPGMSPDVSRRVFEPFYTSKPVGKGTGLGLSVSYFIITDNHKGEMSVMANPGEGACFVIRLPFEEPKPN
ncbi:MAG: AAA family ATPase [Deltaproteobacteria bacterium]|nr:AAA family ATPase [Deltaproteobacteria bacterium]